MFDGSAAKLGEDVIAAVERETDALAVKQAGAQPAPAQTSTPDDAEKPQLLDFLAAAPEAEGDPYADQPTVTAPELPELTPAQELAGYIRSRSAAALVTPHALLVSEVENADIEELTNNQNERFLFSTKHLTRRYAKAISDVDEWTD